MFSKKGGRYETSRTTFGTDRSGKPNFLRKWFRFIPKKNNDIDL